jgi:hypothetical protein
LTTCSTCLRHEGQTSIMKILMVTGQDTWCGRCGTKFPGKCGVRILNLKPLNVSYLVLWNQGIYDSQFVISILQVLHTCNICWIKMNIKQA